jgi:translation initiation factor 2 beta subunit (eIF-2beta)/eIF-5
MLFVRCLSINDTPVTYSYIRLCLDNSNNALHQPGSLNQMATNSICNQSQSALTKYLAESVKCPTCSQVCVALILDGGSLSCVRGHSYYQCKICGEHLAGLGGRTRFVCQGCREGNATPVSHFVPPQIRSDTSTMPSSDQLHR